MKVVLFCDVSLTESGSLYTSPTTILYCFFKSFAPRMKIWFKRRGRLFSTDRSKARSCSPRDFSLCFVLLVFLLLCLMNPVKHCDHLFWDGRAGYFCVSLVYAISVMDYVTVLPLGIIDKLCSLIVTLLGHRGPVVQSVVSLTSS